MSTAESSPGVAVLTGIAVVVSVILTAATVAASGLLFQVPPELPEQDEVLTAASAENHNHPGQAIFESFCAPCHGIGGVGGEIAPAFVDRPVLPDDFVIHRVRSTSPDVMSSFPPEVLSDADLAFIIDYLRMEILGTGIPPVTETELATGKELYKTYCTECHGVFGLGRPDLGPVINQWPPLGIGQIVKGGLLPLPNMPRLSVTQEELKLIALYVQSLAQ